jgi:hypothetical protein
MTTKKSNAGRKQLPYKSVPLNVRVPEPMKLEIVELVKLKIKLWKVLQKKEAI